MSSLKNKLKKLSFFTHYPKKNETLTINNVTEEYPSKKEMWDEWFEDTIYNADIVNQQKFIGSTVRFRYSHTTSGSGSRKIYKWYIDMQYHNVISDSNNFHSSQTGKWKYTRSGESTPYTKVFTLSPSVTTISTNSYETTSSTAPGKTKGCDSVITVSPYYDETNNIYYTGVQYTVNALNITTSYKEYNKSFQEPTWEGFWIDGTKLAKYYE